ncbi:MAG: hypothetical protein ACOZCO_14515 [Bacteroidota bacterium]
MEKYKTQKAYTLHVEHSQWLENLRFYSDELRFLRDKLAEVTAKNTSKTVVKMAEHFQNQFIIQENEIAELKHFINEHERYIEKNVGHNPAADHKSMADHMMERDRMETFEKLFKELKTDFKKFLSRTM